MNRIFAKPNSVRCASAGLLLTALLLMLAPPSRAQNALSDLSQVTCGSLANFGTGPWDYFDPSSSTPTGANPMGAIRRVENVHFMSEIEHLDKRAGSERLASEIFYTLRAFPNHPRALWAMSRLEKMEGGRLPRVDRTGMVPRFSADCFFERAFRFNGDHGPVWMVYGMHSHQRNRLAEAEKAYARAEELGEESASFHYNYALLLADLKKWAPAKEHASKAYALGMRLPGIQEKLRAAGHPLDAPDLKAAGKGSQ